ncbi:hypothetical protein RJ639_010843 [Escallonia herrerae]|uniref:RING-type domain-containing protein n=1 Tax=Escallonia herrerae TaxID=1293975 RepID=A0AA89AQZ4_9ASTE|nr:hypothetical protein RJ639_010843 [Escallonia herrerae]
MGFLFLPIKVPKAISITFFINIINHLKFMFIGALTHLGLFKPAPEEDYSREYSNDYVLILDGSSPSLVPVPVHVITAAIKKKLPVVLYGEFGGRLGAQEVGERACPVCLDCIEDTHEIRQLCNCSHAFHRVCLDTWVDEGQVTCPLCRSMLLPPKRILTGCYVSGGGGGGDPAGVGEGSGPDGNLVSGGGQ